MLIGCIALLIGLSSSLTYTKSSNEPLPINCTLTGWSTTRNSSEYSSYNNIPDAAWVWTYNNTNNDHCTVNITIEYIEGSKLNFTYKSADLSRIYLNKQLIYYLGSVKDSNFSSKFNNTGNYTLSIESLHTYGSYGFSFKLIETYDCPSNCDKCGSPLTCLACNGNTNSINSTCVCPENSVYRENKCHCNQGFTLNKKNELNYCENNGTDDVISNNGTDVIISNNIDVENNNNSNVNIEININLKQEDEAFSEEISTVEVVSKTQEFTIFSFAIFGLVGILSLFFLGKAFVLLRKIFKSTSEIEPDYQIISH